MSSNSAQEDSLRENVRLVMGFLFGSGLAGAAVVMIQDNPEARSWGFGILVLCLVAAGLLFWWSERVVDRRARNTLKKLGDAYVRTLNTTGQILSENLGNVAKNPSFEISTIRAHVFGRLAKDLQSQAQLPLGEDEDQDWVQIFREGVQDTVLEWNLLSASKVEIKDGAVPSGAEPTPFS